jgi:hypothetical protein
MCHSQATGAWPSIFTTKETTKKIRKSSKYPQIEGAEVGGMQAGKGF